MNAKQRRRYDHRHRMEQRAWARRVLRAKPEHTGVLLRILAKITIGPDAFRPNPKCNWWAGPCGDATRNQGTNRKHHHRDGRGNFCRKKQMTTPIVIGAACSHCILDVLALGRRNIIVLVDDPREPAMKPEDMAKVILEFHRVREYPITAATEGTIRFPRMPSKREERQAQQPFYRSLKKYRKP